MPNAHVKWYLFNLVFDEPLTRGECRRLSKLLNSIDWDAPKELDIDSSGTILDFDWRKPFCDEEELVAVLKRTKKSFQYQWIPNGRDHKKRDCPHCDYDGKLQYGNYCKVVPTGADWKKIEI